MDKKAEAVRWAGLALEAEPFRESGYRRLMEAHVAAGNRGEALRVYERCRRLLAEELGAYPSPETDAIYRSLLEAPPGRATAETPDAASPPGTAPPPASRRDRRALVAAALVLLVAVVATGAAVGIVATRGDGPQAASAVQRPRVALVVPLSPPGGDDPSDQYQHAVARARTQDGIRTQTLHIDLSKPGLSKRTRKSTGNFDLVLLAGQFVGSRFAREFKRHPDTRFVILDPDPNNGSLYNAVSNSRNA